ncbi:MAG TPA: CPBP family intramembrane glutamic endopeptidase [Acidobacteriaceae bacterium]|nr:CPBP family intramembrane glutamic endopeptidase [Acidobacteriaceae bacterium]
MLPEPAAPEPELLTEPATSPAVAETRPSAIAPLWHTLLLIAAIAAYSFWGAQRFHPPALDPLAPVPHQAKQAATAHPGYDAQRLIRYALSGVLELIVVAWVWLGLRLRRVSLRSLLGKIPRDLNAITLEAGVAALFWISSMTVLFILALAWQAGATAIYHHQQEQAKQQQSQSPSSAAPSPVSPEKKQLETIRELLELAPANGLEIAAWGALCLIVGFSEELAFRGYLQSQGVALLHSMPLGVLLSAVVFGFAHGYQGLRGMVLIGAFGAMFSIITLMRRSLSPGILAHAWHDFFMGLMLAFIRATHMLDKLHISG